MDRNANVITDLLDSVVTAYALNNDPDEALENLAFYYQVDKKVLEQMLVDVYYSFIVELTDFDIECICGGQVKHETMLKAVIYMIITKNGTVEDLLNMMSATKEDIQSIYSVVSNYPSIIRLVEGYINCANRMLAGPIN